MTTTTVFLLKLVTSEITMFVYRPKTFLKKTKQKIKQKNQKTIEIKKMILSELLRKSICNIDAMFRKVA